MKSSQKGLLPKKDGSLAPPPGFRVAGQTAAAQPESQLLSMGIGGGESEAPDTAMADAGTTIGMKNIIIVRNGQKRPRKGPAGNEIGGLEIHPREAATAVKNWALFGMAIKTAGAIGQSYTDSTSIEYWVEPFAKKGKQTRRKLPPNLRVMCPLSPTAMRQALLAMEFAKNKWLLAALRTADSIAWCVDTTSIVGMNAYSKS